MIGKSGSARCTFTENHERGLDASKAMPVRPCTGRATARSSCKNYVVWPRGLMTTRVDTVVIGGGQAGLAAGYHLSRRGREHLILERGRIGETWRSERSLLRRPASPATQPLRATMFRI
jgi:NADPH-dependent 2,4-dienoyl-CoA reductase/sulfur reductase-like enzyme